MKKQRKQPSLAEQMVADTGLPVPQEGATREDWKQYTVACIFMYCIRHFGDVEVGKKRALAYWKNHKDYADLKPYIDQAAGTAQ
jgi:hypothetical protein